MDVLSSKKVCIKCGNSSIVDIEKMVYKALCIGDNSNIEHGEKIYCPYYQKSEIYNKAYNISRNFDDCFKDSYSCCFCSHRIMNDEADQFCEFQYLDIEVKNMYYLSPINDQLIKGDTYIEFLIIFWTCPTCGSKFELSRTEKYFEFKGGSL